MLSFTVGYCRRCYSRESFIDPRTGECEERSACDARGGGTNEPRIRVTGLHASPHKCRHCRWDMIGRGKVAWTIHVARANGLPLFSIDVCDGCANNIPHTSK